MRSIAYTKLDKKEYYKSSPYYGKHSDKTVSITKVFFVLLNTQGLYDPPEKRQFTWLLGVNTD